MDTIIVTRHTSLIAYLEEIGLIHGDEPVISHATADDIKGKHVIGVLPLSLACLASMVTEIPLEIPKELRGVELTLEQIRDFAGKPTTYHVSVVRG